jgi:cobalt-precorrin 5A hydrolase
MTIALITLSDAGARLLAPLTRALPGARLYAHETVREEALRLGTLEKGNVGPAPDGPGQKPPRREAQAALGPACDRTGFAAAGRFSKIAVLTAELFPVCRGLVFAAPCGVVVRSLAPLITSKHADPAVVVLDAGGRWAVSLLSGHEGGANALAIRVANLVGAEPVISTTTEALKGVIVGIGCRRGTPAERIVAAIRNTLDQAGVAPAEVRLLASADVKAGEAGLLAAAETLGIPIRFIAAAEIRHSARDFSRSDFVEGKVNLPAVAEPAALLAGHRTRFILRRKIVDGITIAIAREDLPRSASDPAARRA